MQNEEIIRLIQEVSKSNLSSFQFEEGNTKLSFEKAKDVEVIVPKEVSQPVESTQVEEKPAGTIIHSPLVGTFYASAEENGASLVEVGDTVQQGQTIGIVEAMKLMNEIEAECNGVIEEVMVGNGQMVEYGQPLFRIKE